jgi:hypothetical protein
MSLDVKGISYVAGDISAEAIRRDLRAIREDLRSAASSHSPLQA